jgi:hypothetical protein
LDLVLVKFTLGKRLIGESFTEVEDFLFSITVKYDAFDFLANFIFFVGLDLLVVDDKAG